MHWGQPKTSFQGNRQTTTFKQSNIQNKTQNKWWCVSSERDIFQIPRTFEQVLQLWRFERPFIPLSFLSWFHRLKIDYSETLDHRQRRWYFSFFETFVFYINIWYLDIPTEPSKVSFSVQSDGTLFQRLVINSGDASCVIVMPHVWDLSVVSRASASFLHLRWPKGHAIPPPHNMALGLDNCQCSRFQNWFFTFDLISM